MRLGHFLILLTQATQDQGVNQAARNLAQSLTQTVLADKSGQDKPGAAARRCSAGQLYHMGRRGRPAVVHRDRQLLRPGLAVG